MSSPFSAANRTWWDQDSHRYHESHARYLESFYWCPELLHEKDACLLGDVSGQAILEVGCGSAPCIDWVAEQGAGLAVGFDISRAMLDRARGVAKRVQADALNLPFASAGFDTVFSAFGAIPFVEDSAQVMREVARVLRPRGRFVFSINHPMRWIFADDPDSFAVEYSYFDRAGYVEEEAGRIVYAEQHRTLGDRLRELRAAGFVLEDLIEPEWPHDLRETWGQWSPKRGEFFPGTAIFVARRET